LLKWCRVLSDSYGEGDGIIQSVVVVDAWVVEVAASKMVRVNGNS